MTSNIFNRIVCCLKRVQSCVPILFFAFAAGTAALAFAAAEWVPASEFNIRYPLFIPGVYSKGSDVTEPKALSGDYITVQTGGVLLVEDGAKLYVRIKCKKPEGKNLVFRAEFPNPERKSKPFITRLDLSRDGIYMLTSPDIIWGLKGKEDYIVNIYIYTNNNWDRPLDVVRQKIRCYVDTRQSEVLLYKGIL